MVSVTRLELCAAKLLAHVEAAAWREGLEGPIEAQFLRDELEHVLRHRPDRCSMDAPVRIVQIRLHLSCWRQSKEAYPRSTFCRNNKWPRVNAGPFVSVK